MFAYQVDPVISQQEATLLAALVTGTVALTVGVLAYVFGRLQKEHEVQFSRLHERRAKVIADLYQLLHEIRSGFVDWDQQNRDEAFDLRRKTHEDLGKKLERFSRLYKEKDILISETIWDKLKQFYRRADGAWSEIKAVRLNGVIEPRRSISAYVPEFEDMAEELKVEYRKVLGIRSPRNRTRESETKAVTKGWLRVTFGLAGTTFMGLGVGGVLYLLGAVDAETIVLCGGLIGLGVGLFIEYIRPSREPLTTRSSGRGDVGTSQLPQVVEEEKNRNLPQETQ